ncbi:MAG: cohesin domain-containing protein [Chloroflexota bacterium]
MKKGIEKVLGSWFAFLVLVTTIVVPTPDRVLAAGNANLVLSTASQTVTVNTSFSVDIQVQSNGEQITAVAAYLDFDPTKLGINSLTPATTWAGKGPVNGVEATVDNVTGRVNYAGGLLGQTVTGTFTIATVNFLAKAAAANTGITFHFAPPSQRDTAISDSLGIQILGTATGASLIIAGVGMTIPQLVSIAVTPPNSSIAAGLTQQFVAVATYSDRSSVDITDAAAWASSNEATATVRTTGKANSGLATGLAAGTTTITAALGAISATTTLTVTKSEEKPVTSPPKQPTVIIPTLPPSPPPPVTPTPPSNPSPPVAPVVTSGTIATTGEPKTTNAPPSAPVTPSVPVTTPAPPPAPAAMALNWWLFGGIAAGVVILVLVSYLLLRRRV